MQNHNENSTTSAGRAGSMTTNPGNGAANNSIINTRHDALTTRAIEARAEISNVVEDFFDIGGLEHPVETITDFLNNFFSGFDDYFDENNNQVPLYKDYTHQYIRDKVYYATEIIKFLIKSKEGFDTLRDINSELKALESERSGQNG